MKRLFDLCCTIGLLILLSPFMAIVAVMVRWRLGSPIIFKQQRAGLHGKPFFIYKFRTMTDEKDANGELLPDEIRLTPFGDFLRRYSLDEFPQLLNVIQGHLSLVGPRPLLMDYLDRYSPEQARRTDVKPGITGWAQVNGRNEISWEEKFQFDIWYVDHQSRWLDIKILFMTIKAVITKRGIHSQDQFGMPMFEGEKSSGSDSQGCYMIKEE